MRLFLAFCLFLAACGGPQRAPLSSQDRLEHIRGLIAEDRLDEAERQLLTHFVGPEAAAQRDRLLGHIAVRRGNARRALSLLEGLRDPAEPNAWLDWDLARAHMMDQSPYAAIDLLAPLIESPPMPIARQVRLAGGEVGLQVGDHELAVQAYGLALAADPRDGEAFMGLARATLQSGAVEEADRLVSARVSRYPADLQPRLLLGEIRTTSNRLEGAVSVYGEVVRRQEGCYEGWRGLGFAHFRLGRFELAVRSLKRAREGLRDDPAIATNLGLALAELDRYREAIEALLSAARVSPESPAVWRSLIEVQLEAGDARGAVLTTRRLPAGLALADPQLEEASFRARLVGAAQMLACGTSPASLSDQPVRDDDAPRDRVPLGRLAARLDALADAWQEADLGAFDPVRARRMLQLPPIKEAIRRATSSCPAQPQPTARTARRRPGARP